MKVLQRPAPRRFRKESSHHRVPCSGCKPSHLFSLGVTRVRNSIVFHFCTRVPLRRQEQVMNEVAGPQKVGK